MQVKSTTDEQSDRRFQLPADLQRFLRCGTQEHTVDPANPPDLAQRPLPVSGSLDGAVKRCGKTSGGLENVPGSLTVDLALPQEAEDQSGGAAGGYRGGKIAHPGQVIQHIGNVLAQHDPDRNGDGGYHLADQGEGRGETPQCEIPYQFNASRAAGLGFDSVSYGLGDDFKHMFLLT